MALWFDSLNTLAAARSGAVDTITKTANNEDSSFALSTSAGGRNNPYRPSRVPPRRFDTCRVAVAAVAGTDQQINEQANNITLSIEHSNSHLNATAT